MILPDVLHSSILCVLYPQKCMLHRAILVLHCLLLHAFITSCKLPVETIVMYFPPDILVPAKQNSATVS